MIPRYSRKEMTQIWEPQTRFRIWFEIEAYACEALAELGVIPKESARNIWEKANDVTFDVERIDEIERVMNVNFWGTANMVKAFLPVLLERPEACILNVSSMGGLVPVPGQGAFGASKAAVKLLTEDLYAELDGTGVQVSVVFPGGVGTNITANSGVEIPAGALGGKMPKTTSPQAAAAAIVDAIQTGRFRVLIGRDARMLDLMGRVAPKRAIGMIARKMHALLANIEKASAARSG